MIPLIVAIISGSGLVLLFVGEAKKLRRKQGHTMTLETAAEAEAAADAEVHTEATDLPPGAEDPDFADIGRAYRIGDMHFARGAFDEAEKYFIKVLAVDPKHIDALDRLGVIYIQQGNPRKAEMIYRELFSITQKDSKFYCNYGRCLYNQGKRAEALEAYENAVKLDATKANRYISIGQIQYEQGDHPKALESFSKALLLEPDNLEYLKLNADLAELLQDQTHFHRSLKKWAELDPYNEAVKEKLARAESSIRMDLPA